MKENKLGPVKFKIDEKNSMDYSINYLPYLGTI